MGDERQGQGAAGGDDDGEGVGGDDEEEGEGGEGGAEGKDERLRQAGEQGKAGASDQQFALPAVEVAPGVMQPSPLALIRRRPGYWRCCRVHISLPVF